jgi:DNA-binding NarL/FixJ family response regulator
MYAESAPSPTICLLASDPITISECQGALYLANFSLRVKQSNSAESGELPLADIYAIDLSSSPMISRGSTGTGGAVTGTEATQVTIVRILSRRPGANILTIGENFDESTAFPLLTMGVKGLVRRSEIRVDLARALTAVHQNGFWVPRQLLSRFVGNVLSSTRRMLFALGSAELTDTQTRLLNCLMTTESDAEIAQTLEISEAELKSQLALLMKKFNVRRRWDLVLLAHQASAQHDLSQTA